MCSLTRLLSDDWIFVVESLKYSDDVIGIPKSGGPSRTVAHRPYGLRDPYYDSTTNQLLMSEITHTGSRVVALEPKPETWPLRPQNSNSSPLTIPEKEWSPEPYRAVKGLLKPYTWLPTIGIFQSDINIDLSAQDPTARWSSTQGLRYNINRQGLWGQTILTAARPWPNLSLESHYGRRSERDLNLKFQSSRLQTLNSPICPLKNGENINCYSEWTFLFPGALRPK